MVLHGPARTQGRSAVDCWVQLRDNMRPGNDCLVWLQEYHCVSERNLPVDGVWGMHAKDLHEILNSQRPDFLCYRRPKTSLKRKLDTECSLLTHETSQRKHCMKWETSLCANVYFLHRQLLWILWGYATNPIKEWFIASWIMFSRYRHQNYIHESFQFRNDFSSA